MLAKKPPLSKGAAQSAGDFVRHNEHTVLEIRDMDLNEIPLSPFTKGGTRHHAAWRSRSSRLNGEVMFRCMGWLTGLFTHLL